MKPQPESQSRTRKRLQRFRQRNSPLIGAAVATALCTLLYLAHQAAVITVPGLARAERVSNDVRATIRGTRDGATEPIVIVGLDDRTREEHPATWQTRRGWAALIDAVAAQQPKLIGVDAFFSAPEINLSQETVGKVRDALEAIAADSAYASTSAADKARTALEAVADETRGDDVLGDAIAEAGNVVLGLLFRLEVEPYGAQPSEALGGARIEESVVIAAPPSARPARAGWVTTSLPAVARGQAGAGAVNVDRTDVAVRTAPLVLEFSGQYYKSLGLTLASKWLGQPVSYATGEDNVYLGDRALPVTTTARATLSYLGAGNKVFRYVSAADFLENNQAAAAVKGKIALIGYTDIARDRVETPFDKLMPGVEVHATLFENIVSDSLMRSLSLRWTVLALLLIGFAITALQHSRIRRRRAFISVGGAFVVAAIYFALAQGMYNSGLVIELAAPMLTAIIVIVTALVTSLATEGREKAHLRATFSQYVQASLVDKIIADPDKARLGGVRRSLTVLFSDIRGFSRFSEQLEPEVLSSFLNEYLTPMTELVMDHGGMLDKYIGDAVMAVYGAPLEMTNHAERACQSALEMQRALTPLNREWVRRGFPEITIGVGLNTGDMSVGNMGSEARFSYTVIGDAVNLGARLEALTKQVGVPILSGEGTAAAAKAKYVFREIGSVQIAGKDQPARVFELISEIGNSPYEADALARFAAGIEAFRTGDLEQAKAAFDEFLAAYPDDGPSKVLRRRIEVHEDSGVGTWTGTLEQTGK